jgi:digeranylgeranylglycerophospholipid reductase
LSDKIRDVVVVGAGPAGSRTARDLARRGYDVVILEEHRAVGEPCHCSGFVTPRTLELADVGDGIVCNAIRGAAVHVRGREPTRFHGSRVHGFVIDRVELDRRLARQAETAGAELMPEARFVNFETPVDAGSHQTVTVNVVREGVPSALRARLLVGADGARSRVASQLRGAPPQDVVVGFGALADYDRNPRTDQVEIFFDPHSAPGWFGWTIPLGGGMARLGTGSANGVGPRESFRRLRHRFPDTFGAAHVRSHSGGLIPIWRPTQLTGDALLLVGDAARQVKPTSGGGIHAALRAAAIAAEAADHAIRTGDLSRRSLDAYATAWNGSLGRELRRQHDIYRAFGRMTTDDLVAVLDLLQDGRLQHTVDATADIDFPSHLIAALGLRRPRLALKLLGWPHFPLAWLPGGP